MGLADQDAAAHDRMGDHQTVVEAQDMVDEDLQLTLRKWRHRRFMAYTALWGALCLVGIVMLLAAVGRAGDLSDFVALLITALGGLFSIVGAYFGFSTWYDRR